MASNNGCIRHAATLVGILDITHCLKYIDIHEVFFYLVLLPTSYEYQFF
jgi:hypothetical protein